DVDRLAERRRFGREVENGTVILQPTEVDLRRWPAWNAGDQVVWTGNQVARFADQIARPADQVARRAGNQRIQIGVQPELGLGAGDQVVQRIRQQFAVEAR